MSTWTIIGVSDVASSLRWYQSLFGQPETAPDHLRPLARRYLGPQAGDHYVETTRSEHEDNVLVRTRPERWLTVDFAKE
jgi:hypothetical protein